MATHPTGHLLAIFFVLSGTLLTPATVALAVPSDTEATVPAAPLIAEASNEGELAIQGITVPQGLKVELVAAEPVVANPVALWIDGQGRIYVCETFRQNKAVTDNRKHSKEWVDDDLAALTVADREAYHRKHLGDKVKAFTEVDDRIRLLDDTDGDGRPDRAVVFADGFNSIVEGTGAGVLARGRDVFYTNIPHLWRLRDTSGDGKADERTSFGSGFGVKVAFRGHDMHGLTIGPDGRLYWSIGDRGYHVELPDGRVLSDPHSGAVFRCELDGSKMEVFATGLRNPQELAFDDEGNLFTGDNNSDSGDKARWVYVVRDGDSGWRMHYQYLGDRGPFNREKIWYPNDPETPAYVVPPIINFADGPSGLTYYPGTGLPEKYRGTFFLCDFRGGAGKSGVRTLKVKPKGAGFEAFDEGEFIWKVLATDCDFGPDGGLYVTDWVNGWDGLGKGRIYKAFDPSLSASPEVLEVKRLLAEGMAERPTADLAKLLNHADRRIRQEAQFELVARKANPELVHAATNGEGIFERLAGVWGLGQLARLGEAPEKEAAVSGLLPLLDDAEAEVQCQAARQLADALHGQKGSHASAMVTRLIPLLGHDNLRVRFFAAEALGQLRDPAALEPLVKMLAENADRDRYLRHAGIMGLAGVAAASQIEALAMHESSSVRLAAVVALRRLKSPGVARFLADADERIVLEAARAIHDGPIAEALPQLAALAGGRTTSDPLLRRIVNANNRLGNAEAIAAIAARDDVPEVVRRIALRALEFWAKPVPRDPVHSGWWPLATRDPAPAATALRSVLPRVLAVRELREYAARAATALGMPEANQALIDLVADADQPGETRADALAALSRIGHPSLADLTGAALRDSSPVVRSTARDLLAKKDPSKAIPLLAAAIDSGEPHEGQAALDTLASLQVPDVDAILADLMGKLVDGELPHGLQLELVEAAKKRKAPIVKEKLGRYESTRPRKDPSATFRECIAGGQADRGRQIFFERAEVSCVRCHRVGSVGGEVGPNLSAIGTKPRQYLLEAITDPNRAIAEGFDTIVVITDEGLSHAGIIKAQDDTTITLMNADGKTIVIDKDSIDEQVPGRSSMPADIMKQLTPRELRDLVEYLSTLKD
jgi:quinoprotein glucose dehydrogenase